MAFIVEEEDCIACGICEEECPEEAIQEDEVATIDEELCLDCGICEEECPEQAIIEE